MYGKIILLPLIVINVFGENKIHYDSFSGSQIPDAELKERVKMNTTFPNLPTNGQLDIASSKRIDRPYSCYFTLDGYTAIDRSSEPRLLVGRIHRGSWCVNEVEPCNPTEGRRIDASCNSLKFPSRGATHTPFYRLLPPVYDKGYEPRKAKDGQPLPMPRYMRTSLWPAGRVPDQVFTQLTTHFLVFFVADIASLHDTINYILWKPYCCLPKGKTDAQCVPSQVPADDPVHRFSEVRCLNLTRPESFQSVGCLPKDSVPERIISSTPTLDMSQVYGSSLESLAKKGRKFEKGMLKYEEENGRIWPPSTKTEIDICLLNQKPAETRCHDTPEDGSNTVLGINLFSIWFWRMHNKMAQTLSEINPCWNDDKLFYTTRDINIAIFTQILYYEILPLLMGTDNLLKDNVISSCKGFRDLYNEQMLPQVSLEYPFALRWFHTMQEGALKMYDAEGYYMKEFPLVNLTLRTGYLAMENNLDYITQGSFRQPSAKIDYVVDPDVSEIALGPHQRATDLLTNDLAKNRLFGFQPYVHYRQFCFGPPYKSFDDLKDVIDPERLEILKEKYKNIEDIDLISGIWMEKPIEGGYIPPTLYCIMTEQLFRSMVSDRHWYERSERPNAFTLEQLHEIRKITVSRLMCDVGDTVTKIQPQGFLRAGPNNQMAGCDQIPKINFNVWKDNTCDVNS